MPTIDRLPGPDDGAAGLVRLAEVFGARQVYDLIRLCRLDAGPGKRPGADASTQLALAMVTAHRNANTVERVNPDNRQIEVQPGDYSEARRAVAAELGYTDTTRTNFYKILEGTARRSLGRQRAGQ